MIRLMFTARGDSLAIRSTASDGAPPCPSRVVRPGRLLSWVGFFACHFSQADEGFGQVENLPHVREETRAWPTSCGGDLNCGIRSIAVVEESTTERDDPGR